VNKVADAIGTVALQHPQFTFWLVIVFCILTDLFIFAHVLSREIRNWKQWRHTRKCEQAERKERG
jgi:hypothetical protein